MRIRASRNIVIRGERVATGSVRDLDDIMARKLLDRGYAVGVELSDEQRLESEDGPTVS
jgi:ribulose bisphosphate carboxylase small subunit